MSKNLKFSEQHSSKLNREEQTGTCTIEPWNIYCTSADSNRFILHFKCTCNKNKQ